MPSYPVRDINRKVMGQSGEPRVQRTGFDNATRARPEDRNKKTSKKKKTLNETENKWHKEIRKGLDNAYIHAQDELIAAARTKQHTEERKIPA